MTGYVVLAKGDGEGWHQVASYREARSGVSAIREYIKAVEEPPSGEFVAVPFRSWRPVSVTVQTETKIKIG